ncbi:MAG TPA: winged helix-turn-helix domain-containing protein [Pyrinomonadaceae bacterium]|nr:winged helix-turn-helix domain-containing protein [Pyrinomonadaceae bacterium]
MTPGNCSAFLFDDVRVEPGTFQAFKAGTAIQLEPKALRLLLFLIENRGRLIEKEEILDAIWNGANVTENALTREIGKLRKILGDDPKAPKYIQTVHTRGYRFIAELAEANGAGTPASAVVEDMEAPPESFRAAQPVVVEPPLAFEGTTAKRTHSYRLITIITIVIGLVTIGGLVLWKKRAATIPPPPPSLAANAVAVLPFKTSVAGEEYLGFEIADALVTRLGNSTKVSVSPITAALHYGQRSQDPRTIGSLMKVDYVLYGEIDRTRQHLSISLIRVRDGVALLAESYDEKFDDIFRLEDSLCAKVLNSLLVTLDHEETQGLQRRYTENQQAYETFLKAHFFMNKLTPADNDKSIDYFQHAIALDPKYAMAYAGLSDSYMRLVRSGRAPADYVPKSRAAVMKALELDETVAYAHSMLGRIAFLYDWDFPRAEREYARARELNPNLVHAWYGSYLLTMNRVAEAEAEQQKFEAFLPFATGSGLSQHFYLTGQYDRVVDLMNRKLEASPNFAPSHEWLGLAYEQQRRGPQAIEEFQKAIALSNGVEGLGSLGHVYAISGKKDEAQKILQKIDELGKRLYLSPYQKAVVYAGLGQNDQALSELEKAYNQRSLSPASLRFDPRLNGLRSEPRFRDFTRRVGLPS